MHSTKSEILALLKRSDGSTVDELASHLRLAPMTVRQHLTVLERDDLVGAEEVRRPTGRPHYLYRLTEDGHRKLAGGFDRLLALLIEQAGELGPDDLAATPAERRARLFRRAAESLAARNRAEVASLSGAARVERIASILRSHGGFPEVEDLGGVYELRDFSCVFRSSVGGEDGCAWHESFLEAILESSVRAAREPTTCAACCRYIVSVTDATR